MSGFESFSHWQRFSIRALTPLMFQVAIFMGGSFLCFALLYPQPMSLTTGHMETGPEQRLPAGHKTVEKGARDQMAKLVPQPQLATAFGFLI